MTTPASMKLGMAVGLLGGLVTFFGLAYLLNIPADGKSTLLNIGVVLLVSVEFFALAGGFASTSQWNQNVLIGFSMLVFGTVMGIGIAMIVPLWFSIIEGVLAIAAIAFASLGSTANYLNNPNRA